MKLGFNRSEAWFSAFVVAVLLLVAINIQAGWLFLLVFAVTSLFICSIALAAIWTSGKLEVERFAPPVFEGEMVDVLVRVTNLSWFTKYLLVLEDQFPSKQGSRSVCLFFPEVKKGGTVERRYREKAEKRGVYRSGRVAVYSPGLSGFLRWRRRVPLSGTSVVYPGRRPFPFIVDELFPSPIPSDGGLQLGRGGDDDFFGIREYSAGGSPRDIHWPSSAKVGKLMIREMNRTHPALLSFYLDCDENLEEESFEEMIRLARFALEESLGKGHIVRMFFQGQMVQRDRWGNLEILASIQTNVRGGFVKQAKENLPIFLEEKQWFIFTRIPDRFDPAEWSFLVSMQESGVWAKLILLDSQTNASQSERVTNWLALHRVPFAIVGVGKNSRTGGAIPIAPHSEIGAHVD